MGVMLSSYNLQYKPEIDLFHLFFSSKKFNKDKNIYNLKLPIINNNNFKTISSIIYTIQFLENKNVIQEITIHLQYNYYNNNIKVNIRKHMLTNNVMIYDDMFPYKPFYITNNSYLKFDRVSNNKFLILLNQNSSDNYIIIGAINFKNIKNYKSIITIEHIIKCVIKTYKKKIDNYHFVVPRPIINDNHYISLYKQQYLKVTKKNKYIYLEDIITKKIDLNLNNTYIYNWNNNHIYNVLMEFNTYIFNY
jgi:hypothetical protein